MKDNMKKNSSFVQSPRGQNKNRDVLIPSFRLDLGKLGFLAETDIWMKSQLWFITVEHYLPRPFGIIRNERSVSRTDGRSLPRPHSRPTISRIYDRALICRNGSSLSLVSFGVRRSLNVTRRACNK